MTFLSVMFCSYFITLLHLYNISSYFMNLRCTKQSSKSDSQHAVIYSLMGDFIQCLSKNLRIKNLSELKLIKVESYDITLENIKK